MKKLILSVFIVVFVVSCGSGSKNTVSNEPETDVLTFYPGNSRICQTLEGEVVVTDTQITGIVYDQNGYEYKVYAEKDENGNMQGIATNDYVDITFSKEDGLSMWYDSLGACTGYWGFAE